ncbi:dual adapter for phosphotyrosine and 3-phosphotyrosine and 3-phosphoinositide isoform X1 [Petromyzon marinus]|uniref:Dual adapter for phosphotyrosine and 3-phosphotyrosine and 3-phosphoinositide isoform X1 n=2 Tax=Petromyzon marinus TaxID=7757 RepID=A0AAJ7WQ38_PETMA|nr:dual adapter for phosphotyrosine and 3-phosphotyrosine and 3-phosphoinositide isoform X1 [Petromyzon marinus]XP_032806014.1 dual adapter for phosphotyrosine and 3-phosphotyrosine and 3-phosphoinositide isoform X1 [Petromyzon marinus]
MGTSVEKELSTFQWYHGTMSRHVAEAMLMQNGQEGSYLFRRGLDGQFVLAARSKDSVRNFQVSWSETRGFSFGFTIFPTVKEFADHLANEPILGSETGGLISLRFPFPREVAEPSFYDPIIVHTAMRSGRTIDDVPTYASSVGTKEGFLNKQGNRVKTWKRRWFTLQRNELKYFKDRKDTEPIKALDLSRCTAVQFDYSREKVNCFCLVFPERTFFLCAKNALEADEWIKLLRWKMNQEQKQRLLRKNKTMAVGEHLGR